MPSISIFLPSALAFNAVRIIYKTYPAKAPRKIAPSRCPRVIPCASPHARYPSPRRINAQRTEKGISLTIVSRCTRTGVRIAHTPITNIRLKMFEPTTLLIASSLLCTIDAVTLTAVSGRDVPIATIVSPIIIDGTFNFFAMLELPSTKKSAPLIRNTNPMSKNTTTSINGALFIYCSIKNSFHL